jgi:hypothetical protein
MQIVERARWTLIGRRLVSSGLLWLALLGLPAIVSAPAAAQGGLPRITVPADLDDDRIELYADKLDVYAALLAGTSRTVTNAIRYLKNFDLKTGPKGTEDSTYDLLNLNTDLYADLIRKARAAAAEEPAIPELDKAALAYAEAVASNPAVFNEAAEYYSSARRYEEDRYEHGKTLHPKIAHEITRYFATLPPFMGFLHQVRAQIDPQEIAILEKAGRAPARALARKLTTVGRQASLFVPTNASREIDTRGFDAALKAYGDQVAAYKAYRRSEAGQADKSLTVFSDQRIEGLYRTLRDIRQAYNLRRRVPLQYELLILPFYEDYGAFWSEMLDIVERNPWEQARPLAVSVAPARVLPPPPAIAIPDLTPKAIAAWTQKNEAARELLARTNALVTAWNTYTEWVDEHRGPTGKERHAGSFGAIDRGQFTAAAQAARRLADAKPDIAALDATLSRYADAIEALLPVAVSASGYYTRQEFLADGMQGGKELHRPLMRDYRPFLEARSDLSGTVRMLRDGIESKELASIEEREGRSPRWHRLHILRMARALRASVPQGAKPSAADLQGFDRAIAEFAQAVKALEAAQDPVGDRVVNEANAYIGKLRRLRQDYGRPTFSLDSSLSSLDISVATLANAAQGRR